MVDGDTLQVERVLRQTPTSEVYAYRWTVLSASLGSVVAERHWRVAALLVQRLEGAPSRLRKAGDTADDHGVIGVTLLELDPHCRPGRVSIDCARPVHASLRPAKLPTEHGRHRHSQPAARGRVDALLDDPAVQPDVRAAHGCRMPASHSRARGADPAPEVLQRPPR